MKLYLGLLQDVLDNGTWRKYRTGIRAKFVPGAMLKRTGDPHAMLLSTMG